MKRITLIIAATLITAPLLAFSPTDHLVEQSKRMAKASSEFRSLSEECILASNTDDANIKELCGDDLNEKWEAFNFHGVAFRETSRLTDPSEQQEAIRRFGRSKYRKLHKDLDYINAALETLDDIKTEYDLEKVEL